MERDIVWNGVHIGEHGFELDQITNEIYERCVKPGLNLVTIRTPGHMLVPQEYFIRWAEYLTAHKIYFIFLYTQHTPDGRESHLEPETVAKMREIAGEYFIGDMLGETGASGACKFPGYYTAQPGASFSDPTKLETQRQDMKTAAQDFVDRVAGYVDIDRRLGIPEIVTVDSTVFNRYNLEAGVTFPALEMMCGQPDIAFAACRGAARAYHTKYWGSYVAHEWYGGYRHDDMLKRKRLEIAYKYAYLAGTNLLCLESGDEMIRSYGHEFPVDSPLCEDYRRVLTDTMKLIREDERPVGGPKVKVAFVHGRYDSWSGWCYSGSSVWNQFYREEWGYGEAEHSWRLLDEIGSRRPWHEQANYGDCDLSALPACGMYDIVPIEADVDVLSRYDTLIFLGWNTLIDEDMDKLTEYVRRGGHLLMSAAHLNKESTRDGKRTFPASEKIEKLFGCRFTGKTQRTNAGLKFQFNALNETMLYPGTKSFFCDPVYSAGYVEYAEVELCGGTETAYLSESFRDDVRGIPALIENKVGSGIATLIPAVNYPGNPAFAPLYRAVVREMITASTRNCEIQVLGSDRLRYSVYGDGDQQKIYLLNTDYDLPIAVRVKRGEKEEKLFLEPMELKILESF